MNELSGTRRLAELDAMRGLAMVAVVLTHSDWFRVARDDAFGQLLTTVGMLATPTFLLLSGAVANYVASTSRSDPRTAAVRIIDRALFLALVVHTIYGAAHALYLGTGNALLRSVYVTDALAVSLVLVAGLGQRASGHRLMVIGATVFVASTLVASMLTADEVHLRWWARATVGLVGSTMTDPGYVVPVVPYAGLVLIGAGAGRVLADLRRAGCAQRDIARRAFALGACALATVAALKLAWLNWKLPPGTETASVLFEITEWRQKIPPSLAYGLTYGGTAFLATGAMLVLGARRPQDACLRMLAVVGRASLLVFVLQDWLIAVPTRAFGVHGGNAFWLVATLSSAFALYRAARAWDAAGGGRYLTLGLPRYWAAAHPTIDAPGAAGGR